MRVELRDEARDDLANGAWFYGRQSPELDDYFLESLHDDLRSLQAVFGVHERYRGFYRKLSKRFPFAIYYLVTDETIDVVAILDCRSDPKSTDTRLGRTRP
jgi:plasmid stabilization system protein ParE